MTTSQLVLPTTIIGGCHCGAVQYQATIRVRQVIECNCSICTQKGYLHMIIPREDFVLLTGRDDLATYTFGTHSAQHHFCKHCGIHSFYIPRSHPNDIDINVRCLQTDILSSVDIQHFNGREWDENIGQLIT